MVRDFFCLTHANLRGVSRFCQAIRAVGRAIDDQHAAAAAFKRHFEEIFASSEPLPLDWDARREAFSRARN